jgi:hypothetical protein
MFKYISSSLSSRAAIENAVEAKVRTDWQSVLFKWCLREEKVLWFGPIKMDKTKHFYNHVLMAEKCKQEHPIPHPVQIKELLLHCISNV